MLNLVGSGSYNICNKFAKNLGILMTVERGLTDIHVVFKLTIPLFDHEPFNLNKIIPVPSIIKTNISH